MNHENDISIRAMTPRDFDTVAALCRELDTMHADRLPWLFQHPSQSPRDTTYFGQILGDERSAVIIAGHSNDERIAGFIHVRLLDTPDFPIFVPQLRGVVEAIFVTTENRGGGVAAALMQAAENWATERGAKGMDLIVYEFNESARSAFAAMGYEILHRKMSKPTGKR